MNHFYLDPMSSEGRVTPDCGDRKEDIMTPTDFDAEDVKAALERETQDGPGFDNEDDLPEGDAEEDSK